jgi:hypothetical protein
MRKCDLLVARTADGYLIRIEGHATLRYSPALSAFATQALTACASTAIAVDLRACQFLDSTFLGCLLTLQRRVVAAPAEFAVVVDDWSRKLLSASRLDSVLKLKTEAPPAVSEFVTLTTSSPDTEEFGRHVAASHHALAELPGDHSRLYRDIADRIARELQDRPGCI